MDAAAEIGRNPVSMEMGKLARDEIAEPVTRVQILRRKWKQGKNPNVCSVQYRYSRYRYVVVVVPGTVMYVVPNLP